MTDTERPDTDFGGRQTAGWSPVRSIGRFATQVAMLLSAVVAIAVPLGIGGSRAEAIVMLREERIESAGPLGAVTVIGDSVLLGSYLYGPTLGEQLAAQGWGPIRSRAAVGMTTGNRPIIETAMASFFVARWRGEGWDAPNVLINLGANDSARCRTDVQCARDAIFFLVNDIGPGHHIWWPQITLNAPNRAHADAWNEALRQIDAELTTFTTWDWPLVMQIDRYRSTDNIHLDVSSYRRRSERMAAEFTADLGRAQRTGGDAALPEPAAPPSEFVPMTTVRALDTRLAMPGSAGAAPLAADSFVRVDLARFLPAGANAVSAYVSATNTMADGYLTTYACDQPRPLASTTNFRAGQTRGAVAVSAVSAAGELCVYSSAAADVLVDLQGAFVDVADQPPDGLRFSPLATPSRLVDTRITGRATVLTIPAPLGAAAVAVNLTAIAGDHAGHLTAYPCGPKVPLAATVNHGPGDVIAGAAFVPVSEGGDICVYSLAPIDVVVDLTGTFAPDDGLAFVAVQPTRTVDTRDGTGGWSPLHGAGQTIDARVAPPGALAVTGTLTIAFPRRPIYLRAWGCGAEPDTSSVNGVDFGAIANSLTTGVDSAGRLCVFSLAATGTVFDTTGWWVELPISGGT